MHETSAQFQVGYAPSALSLSCFLGFYALKGRSWTTRQTMFQVLLVVRSPSARRRAKGFELSSVHCRDDLNNTYRNRC